ncbi:hypothetical protein WJX79_000163 [Trebouxia sp. C0005]
MTYRYVANIRLAGNTLCGCGLEDRLSQAHSASVESSLISHRQFLNGHQAMVMTERDGDCHSEQLPPFSDVEIDRWHLTTIWARSVNCKGLAPVCFQSTWPPHQSPTKHFTETLAESFPGNPEC